MHKICFQNTITKLVLSLFKAFSLFALLMPVSLNILAAPDFSLADIQGNEHKLSDYKGKWVVVNYWATWCPPCVEEIPELVFFHEKHKANDAVVLGVNFENAPEENVREFLDEYMVSYPVLLSEPAYRGQLGVIKGLPTTYIISPEGKIVHEKVGRISVAYLENQLKQLKSKIIK